MKYYKCELCGMIYSKEVKNFPKCNNCCNKDVTTDNNGESTEFFTQKKLPTLVGIIKKDLKEIRKKEWKI